MNKTEIGQKILNRFAEMNSKPEHIIDYHWINLNLYTKLNPKEQDLIESAIEELVDNGFIYIDNRAVGKCIVLTQKGFDKIYPLDKTSALIKIKSRIMTRFKEQNSRPNHVIQIDWISMNLMQELNPKEQELVNEAIEQLIQDGLLLLENRSGIGCLVLTEKGYNTLY